jgi:hypothetical protein
MEETDIRDVVVTFLLWHYDADFLRNFPKLIFLAENRLSFEYLIDWKKSKRFVNGLRLFLNTL